MESSSHSTEQLIERIEGGDMQAIGLLLEKHRPQLKYMVSARFDRRLVARFDPSDVVQEALVTAHQRISEYLTHAPFPFYVWLRKIAWNRLIDLHRRHVQAQRRSVDREVDHHWNPTDDSMQLLVDRLPAGSLSPSQRLAHKEAKSRLQQAIGRLAPVDREIVLLRHLEGLSVNYVARILDISESAVKSRHFRAIEKLRKWIDE